MEICLVPRIIAHGNVARGQYETGGIVDGQDNDIALNDEISNSMPIFTYFQPCMGQNPGINFRQRNGSVSFRIFCHFQLCCSRICKTKHKSGGNARIGYSYALEASLQKLRCFRFRKGRQDKLIYSLRQITVVKFLLFLHFHISFSYAIHPVYAL